MKLEKTVDILRNLVAFESVSATENVSISRYVSQFLRDLGLKPEEIGYVDSTGVEKLNVIATTGSANQTGGLLYCAHTDVVPVTDWTYPQSGPFELSSSDGKLFGRGSCDMKGSLACFLAALETVDFSKLNAPLSIICTADEETGYRGAAEVASRSKLFRTFCEQQPVTVIGEPTMLEVVHAHKGIYTFKVKSQGKSAHSSTNEGENANLKMIPFLQEMKKIHDEVTTLPEWQHDGFSPSGISWNIGINDHTPAVNITPEQSICTVSFRPMPGQQPELLLERAEQAAISAGLEYETLCQAPPVFVAQEAAHINQFLKLTGNEKSRSVAYGTDAAMFLELEKLVVCGPGDIAQAHTDDEWISTEQLEKGTSLYQQVIQEMCTYS